MVRPVPNLLDVDLVNRLVSEPTTHATYCRAMALDLSIAG